MQNKDSYSINFGNQSFVLEQLSIYLKNRDEVSSDWAAFFQGMEFASESKNEGSSVLDAYKKNGHLLSSANPMCETSKGMPELSNNEKLKSIYCGNISYECYNIENEGLEKWFHEEIQKDKKSFTSKEYELILSQLWQAKYL